MQDKYSIRTCTCIYMSDRRHPAPHTHSAALVSFGLNCCFALYLSLLYLSLCNLHPSFIHSFIMLCLFASSSSKIIIRSGSHLLSISTDANSNCLKFVHVQYRYSICTYMLYVFLRIYRLLARSVQSNPSSICGFVLSPASSPVSNFVL